MILGISEAPQAVSFPAMAQRQQALAEVILQDPAVESLSSFIGIDGTNTTLNSGRIQINLKPLRGAQAQRQRRHPPAAARAGAGRRASRSSCSPCRTSPSRTGSAAPSSSTRWRTPTPRNWATGCRSSSPSSRPCPSCATWPATSRTRACRPRLVIDRDTASRLGITPQTIDDTLYDAFGQRQVSTIFTQLNQYHVVLEVAARLPAASPSDLDDIYLRSPPAAQVPLERLHPASRQHRARWPSTTRGSSRSVTISFNLAPGASLGDAVDGRRAGPGRSWTCPPASRPSFQGTAQAFQASLANEPLLILAALVTVYIVLGVLYESYIHPITILSTLPSAGVGALLALHAVPHRLQRHRPHRHHPAHRHRQEERHHDDRLRPRGRAQGGQAARRGHLPGLPAALPAHHDDHHGGPARRRCRWPWAPGVGSELRRPLGIAIVGGLIFSQVLTLYTTPVIYLAFDRLAKRLSASRGPSGPSRAAQPAGGAMNISAPFIHRPSPRRC